MSLVYVHWCGDTPIWVGTGTRHRALSTSSTRNKPYRDHIAKHGRPRVEILHEGLTKDEGRAIERALIAKWLRTCDGGTLFNVSPGHGSEGCSPSAEALAKRRETIRSKPISAARLAEKAARSADRAAGREAARAANKAWWHDFFERKFERILNAG